jgi:UDP-N-acetylmuramoyl-L-alanyl-D-glutamate--2,6-diaminopimelate ligase
MAKIAECFCDNIILTTDNPRCEDPREIIHDIEKGFEKKCYSINENRPEAIRKEILNADQNDIIAILGKGVEKYMIANNTYEEYDEIKIVKDALRERKKRNYANKAQ